MAPSHQNKLHGITRLSLAILTILVFSLLFSLQHEYPGLFMDSVNPEYLASRILYHSTAQYDQVYIVPGNLILDRFPILAGSFYHGPLQLYTSLPIYYIFDTSITSARIAQGMYGLAILAVSAALFRRAAVPLLIAALTLLLLAVDPAFMQSFKTQALSTVWPLSLLLGSVYITERWAIDGRLPRTWELMASGTLAGLAFFSYFIYLFFFPAMLLHLLMAWRSAPRHRGFWSTLIIYCLGFLFGCLPYFVGYWLIYERSDGLASFYAYLTGAAHELRVTGQGSTGISAKIMKVISSSRMATDDTWISLAIFRSIGVTFLGSWKLLLLWSVLLLGLLLGKRGQEKLRLPVFFLTACLGFMLLALPFGTRLDGHHFVVLLPLLYLGAAFSATAILARQYRAVPKELAPLVFAACFVLLAYEAAITQYSFQNKLRQTHGIGAYSATINDLARDALEQPNELYALPDWGFFMPFSFLTRGKVRYTVNSNVTREAVMRSVCRGQVFNLVRAGDDWVGRSAVSSLEEKKIQARSLVPGLTPRTTRYRHEDGSPVFDVHRYELPNGLDPGFCGVYAPAECKLSPLVSGASLQANPCSLTKCPKTPPRAIQVKWESGSRSREPVEIWVAANSESPKKLWTIGPASGTATTGAWAGPGNVFELRQTPRGETLALLTLGEAECQTAP